MPIFQTTEIPPPPPPTHTHTHTHNHQPFGYSPEEIVMLYTYRQLDPNEGAGIVNDGIQPVDITTSESFGSSA